MGFGCRVYVIDPKKGFSSEIVLGSGGWSYFRAFYADQDHLLVASGRSLLRLASDGKVLWKMPNLALDGVNVESVAEATRCGCRVAMLV